MFLLHRNEVEAPLPIECQLIETVASRSMEIPFYRRLERFNQLKMEACNFHLYDGVFSLVSAHAAPAFDGLDFGHAHSPCSTKATSHGDEAARNMHPH
ncbi:Hypothetical protein NTJ_02818 [Nesidiocoris tenuis]|uniref:Uncharacterized protein n=1 Tax=Nesidiocoris tenuis TaxID=355587 RepID=A0ABN7ACL3_9HEMI|nr:Hypothetical protein NTJ_02818 [Nesidiocoris tenuis]